MTHAPTEIANALLTAGEVEDALVVLNAQLDTQPDDIDARRLRAALLLRMAQAGTGDYQAALADLDSITQPTAADHHTRSLIYEALGNLAAAVDAAHASRAAAPDNSRSVERIVKLLMQAQRWAEAQALVAEMQRQHDDWRWAQWAGDVASAMGDDHDALAHYQSALDALEDSASNIYVQGVKAYININVAKIYYRFGQLAYALEGFNRASHLVDDPILRYHSCLIQLLLGDDNALVEGKALIAQADEPLRKEMRNIDHDIYAIFTEVKG